MRKHGTECILRSVPLSRADAATTLLLPIELMGQGTELAESIPSVVERLAFIHRVTRRRLVQFIRRSYLQSDFKGALRSSALVTGGWEAHTFASELAQATGSPGIRHGALLILKDALPMIAPRNARYCPECIDGWVEGVDISGRESWPAWTPSLWEIELVGSCPIHGIQLIPAGCNRGIGGGNAFVPELPGVCGKCGSIGYRCGVAESRRSEPHELWVASQVGKVIATLSGGDQTISHASIARGVARLRAELSAVWNRDRDTWRSGRRLKLSQLQASKQPFHTVVAACMSLGCEIPDVLRGKLTTCEAPSSPPGHRLSAQGWTANHI
jgi:hypothetical protein